MKTIDMQVSGVYEQIANAKTRIIDLEGGARSTKTYSTLQYFIVEALQRRNIEYDIVRETFPALRATAMRDFFDILKSHDIYNEKHHNKSENIYRLHGCNFNFYSTDDAQKLRGRKRHKILLNEANEQSLETFRQVIMRTTEQCILDYNPSDEEHWIYEHVIPRSDCTFVQSTYKDNPFLEPELVAELERLEQDDPEYWKIYGLGLRGKRQGLIYQNWDIVPEFPECHEILYGMDFGFNDPKVVVKIGRNGNDVYIDELFYQSNCVREKFVEVLKTLIPEKDRHKEQYGDAEDPESITVIHAAGFNIRKADKGPGSVLSGIEEVKKYRLHITARSVNVLKDFKNYKWKTDKNGKSLDEPIHAFSHSPDAVRYPIHTHWGRKNGVGFFGTK